MRSPEYEHTAKQVAPEVLPVGFCSFNSFLGRRRGNRTAAVAWSAFSCARDSLPGNGGCHLCLPREQERGRDGAAEASLRLQANQIQNLVRANPASNALRVGVVVWRDARDGSAASGSAVCDSVDAGPAAWVLRGRAGRGIGLVGIRYRSDARPLGRAS